ncbi:MAG: gfo/Idh/MocA family oxidoreductase [Ignavibacteriae bacterium]|nr:MAG: gfo/Idh/MocA family oxidoreductase [Ignavibacteriota bacterium]
MKTGIIGLGYWGPNLVRNFSANQDIKSVVACDLSSERLQSVKKKFPNVEICNDPNELINKNVDAIAIATPVHTHYNLGKQALLAGKHIWVEKPFASNVEQALELLNIAEQKNLKIFVDHTFIYTGAVKKIGELVRYGDLGNIKYFDSVRINLGLFQHDINVLWDLAPHDLSIMNYVLTGHKVEAISANGIANYYDLENIAHLSLYFNSDCYANLHLNWTSPVKIRRIIVGGDKKMLVYDDMENFEKIKVYDSSIEVNTTESMHEALVQYRIGDMYSPKIKQTEALALGVEEFIRSIKEGKQPLTSGYDGLEIVKILEASKESIKNRGKLIYVSNQ